jgi:hypothetical protein
MTDLSGADLTGADLSAADLSGANLCKAHLSEADLSKANLSKADLSEANLGDAYLSEARLYMTDLRGADLIGAHLYMTDLSGADLTGADLSAADLSWANLTGARLFGARLSGANLSGAHLDGAHLYETVFGNTNLREVQGLDSCVHTGPSTVDHRTLALSGQLPLAFLRGCGLPDKLIEYLPSILNEAIQFYSCFISYSTEDEPFAERLHADLQNNGVRCWFAPHHIQAGKKIHEQIDEAIRLYDRLLLVISDHSMKSRWVKTEIANARKKELTQHRQVLFPIRLVEYEAIRPWKLFDADVGDDSASEIREYFIPDFSRWKDHDAYRASFDHLLHDLKASV